MCYIFIISRFVLILYKNVSKNHESANCNELMNQNDQYSILFNKSDNLIMLTQNLNYDEFRVELRSEEGDFLWYLVSTSIKKKLSLNCFEKYERFQIVVTNMKSKIDVHIYVNNEWPNDEWNRENSQASKICVDESCDIVTNVK